MAQDGSLVCPSEDMFVLAGFQHWLHDRACGHEDGVLIHRSIGGTDEVQELRAALGEFSERYGLLRSHVLPDTPEADSIIASEQLPAFRTEVIALGDIHCEDCEKDALIRRFRLQMTELVECAMFAHKPIAFRIA